jgi:hypothetical protein
MHGWVGGLECYFCAAGTFTLGGGVWYRHRLHAYLVGDDVVIRARGTHVSWSIAREGFDCENKINKKDRMLR